MPPCALGDRRPSSPNCPRRRGKLLIYRLEPDWPQPRRDRDAGDGLAWTVGKVRQCPVLDVRYMALTHNTLRGAASGALLNAELRALYRRKSGTVAHGQPTRRREIIAR